MKPGAASPVFGRLRATRAFAIQRKSASAATPAATNHIIRGFPGSGKRSLTGDRAFGGFRESGLGERDADDAVAAGGFGLVERLVGAPEHFSGPRKGGRLGDRGRQVLRVHRRDPDADRDAPVRRFRVRYV